MNRQSTNYEGTHLSDGPIQASFAAVKRISWGSVFAGALIALVVQLTLSLLGLGIGMGSIDPMEESNPLAGLGTGSLIWWSVSMLISLFVGGWVAGRLAGIPTFFDSIIHGLLTWSVVTLLSFYLLTTAVGKIIGGVGSVIGKTVSLAGQGIKEVAPEIGDAVKSQLQESNIDLTSIKQEAKLLLQQTGKAELQPGALEQQAQSAANEAKQEGQSAAANPQSVDESADNLVNELFAKGGNIAEEIDREAVVNVIVARTGKSEAEAGQIADNWIATFEKSKAKFQETKEQVVAKAEKGADDVASAMSKAGFFAFLGLVLGAGASGFGGKVGSPHDMLAVQEPVGKGI